MAAFVGETTLPRSDRRPGELAHDLPARLDHPRWAERAARPRTGALNLDDSLRIEAPKAVKTLPISNILRTTLDTAKAGAGSRIPRTQRQRPPVRPHREHLLPLLLVELAPEDEGGDELRSVREEAIDGVLGLSASSDRAETAGASDPGLRGARTGGEHRLVGGERILGAAVVEEAGGVLENGFGKEGIGGDRSLGRRAGLLETAGGAEGGGEDRPHARPGGGGLGHATKIGDRATFAGQVGVSGHLNIGSNTTFTAASGVLTDVPDGEIWGGFPSRPHKETLREYAALSRLPEFMRRVERYLFSKDEGK